MNENKSEPITYGFPVQELLGHSDEYEYNANSEEFLYPAACASYSTMSFDDAIFPIDQDFCDIIDALAEFDDDFVTTGPSPVAMPVLSDSIAGSDPNNRFGLITTLPYAVPEAQLSSAPLRGSNTVEVVPADAVKPLHFKKSNTIAATIEVYSGAPVTAQEEKSDFFEQEKNLLEEKKVLRAAAVQRWKQKKHVKRYMELKRKTNSCTASPTTAGRVVQQRVVNSTRTGLKRAKLLKRVANVEAVPVVVDSEVNSSQMSATTAVLLNPSTAISYSPSSQSAVSSVRDNTSSSSSPINYQTAHNPHISSKITVAKKVSSSKQLIATVVERLRANNNIHTSTSNNIDPISCSVGSTAAAVAYDGPSCFEGYHYEPHYYQEKDEQQQQHVRLPPELIIDKKLEKNTGGSANNKKGILMMSNGYCISDADVRAAEAEIVAINTKLTASTATAAAIASSAARQLAASNREREKGRFKPSKTKWIPVTAFYEGNGISKK